jgi:hypothetical protein
MVEVLGALSNSTEASLSWLLMLTAAHNSQAPDILLWWKVDYTTKQNS